MGLRINADSTESVGARDCSHRCSWPVIVCIVALTAGLCVVGCLYLQQRDTLASYEERLRSIEARLDKSTGVQKQSEDLYFVDVGPIGGTDGKSPGENTSRTRLKRRAERKNASNDEGSGRGTSVNLTKKQFGKLKRKITKGISKKINALVKKIGNIETKCESEHSSLNQTVKDLTNRVGRIENESGDTIFGAQFVGDVNKVHSVNGEVVNGKFLKSKDGRFPDWTKADWMNEYEHSDKFEKMSNGGIRVKEGGLYWIYAQIAFFNAEAHNTLFLKIKKAGDRFERLMACSHSNAPLPAGRALSENTQAHTCFGGGISALEPNDEIHVIQDKDDTEIYWTSDRAFVGLVRLA